MSLITESTADAPEACTAERADEPITEVWPDLFEEKTRRPASTGIFFAQLQIF